MNANKYISIFLFFSLPFSVIATEVPVSLLKANFLTPRIIFSEPNGGKSTFARVSSQDLGNGNFSWIGKNLDGSNDSLSFSRINRSIFGSLTSKGGIQHFRTLSNRIVFQNNASSRMLSCGGCVAKSKTASPEAVSNRRAKNWRNGDGNLIDILVAYTADAKTSQNLSSEGEVAAYVQNAISESNLCFLNSKVNASLRLVHLVEIDYDETQDPATDLNRSTNKTDGYLDELHTLRDQYGADLVTLLISEGDGSLGGIANFMNYPTLDFEDNGFNVVVMDQIGSPSYSLLHEIGHNMGCSHNREDAMNRGIPDTDPSNTSVYKAFNYGKRWIAGDQGYRTIMAYDTSGSSTYPNRVPLFSNPQVSYLGVTTGNSNSEDNAQVLNQTAPYVSNFRSSIVQAIVPSVHSLTIFEGNASSFTVRLATKPDANLSVAISLDPSGDSGFGIPLSQPLEFNTENWNLPQPVQVISNQDDDDNDSLSSLLLSATGLSTATVELRQEDLSSEVNSTRILSGIVTDVLGLGIPNVSLDVSGFDQPILTDENGSFHMTVENNWSGVITPSKSDHQFSPISLSISSSHDSTHLSFEAQTSEILFVNPNATGNGDGSSWANAYTDLRSALQSIKSFDEVWVAEGTYTAGGFRSNFFLIPPQVSVYGGFSGSETSREQRDPVTNQTILSGDIGTLGDGSDNAFHLVIPSDGSHLDGFFIKEGNATENYSDDRGKGGGLFAKGVTFTVANTTFQGNQAYQKGGAVYLYEANATFSNCTFSNNISSSLAGAIYAFQSKVTLNSCQILNNQAELDGGGVYAENTELNATTSEFRNNHNTVNNGGGGIRIKYGILRDINGSYAENQTASSGGGIYASDSNITLEGSTFSSNQADYFGAGCRLEDSNATISESVFNLNSAGSNGGGLYFSSTTANLTNNSFVSNHSDFSGGAIFATDSNLTSLANDYSQNSANSRGGANASESGAWAETEGNYTFNSSTYKGGALSLESSTGSIADSNFTANSNTTYNGGGALSLDSASPSISNCKFTANLTNTGYGGAIYMNATSSPTIESSLFSLNRADGSSGYGGGLYFSGNSGVQISSSTFNDNYAFSGGAFASWGADDLLFSNCQFVGNEANVSVDSSGGMALLANGADQTKFVNCLISNNQANGRNGVFKPEGITRFVNCTISRNSAGTYGGISILFAGESVEFENSILWENSGPSGGADLYLSGGTATIESSIFEPSNSVGSITSANSLSDNPLFQDSNGADDLHGNEDDDYSLQSSSPAIDQGDSDAADYLAFDILGKSRYGAAPDLGAYEYRVNASPVITEGSSHQLNASEDQMVAHTFSASDTDNDDLSWSLSNPASNGSVSVTSSTGQVTYQPNLNWYGNDSFVLSVSDGGSDTSITVSVSVASVDDPPFVNSAIPDQSLQEDDDNLTIDLTSFFSDIDSGETFIYSASSSDDSLVNASIEGSSLILSLIADQFGSAVIEVNASSNDLAASDSFSVSVSSVDDPPFVNSAIPDQSLQEDDDNLTIDLTSFFSDIDSSETFIYSVSSSDDSLVNASIEGSSLILSLVADQFGSAVIEVNASSNDLATSDSLILTVQAVNDLPTFNNPPDSGEIVVLEGSSYVFDFNASDRDGDQITFSISGTDAELFEINASTGILTFKEIVDFENPTDSDLNNSYDLSLIVADPSSSAVNLEILVSVLDQDEYAWTTAGQPAANWRFTDWFGYYFESSDHWIFHIDHGWLYRVGESMSSTWFYDSSLDWIWTSHLYYPYFFTHSGDWLYFESGESATRRFYNYSDGSWTTIQKN